MVEKTELEFIFNSTQDAMFMAEYTGGEFRYIRINSAHQKISGFDNSDIRGKTPIEVWGKETGEKLHNFYLEGILSTDGKTIEEALDMGGKTHVFMTRLMPAVNNGRDYLIVSRTDITQLRALQAENIVLLRRLQAMFSDHSAVMLVIDPETGRILNANPSACVFYGYDMSELLSLNIQDINMLPQEETARLRKRALERKEEHFIFPHRLKSEEIRLVEVYSSPFESKEERYLYSIIFDVTDREMYKENLYREKEMLNTTLRSIGDGVITTDVTGKITAINKVAEEITQWRWGEAVGRKFSDVFILVNERDGTTPEDPVKKVLETGKIIGLAKNTALIAKNKEKITIADSAAPIKNEEGKVFGAVIVFRDIRAEKARQEEVLFLSYHDALTGLYNRRFIESEIRRLDRDIQLPVSVIMGDVNGLKIANDVFSHETGDQLLKKVSEIFKECCGENNIVARWGGDEFLIVMPGAALEDAEAMIHRLQVRFKESSAKAMQLSVSLGCAEKTDLKQPLSDVIRQAEEWMYHQKLLEGKSYRNSIVNTLLATLYEKSMETEEHAKRLMAYCHAVGEKLAFSDKVLNELSLLAVLHDIGKVGIKEEILKKPEKLTPEEWLEMKKHPEIGYRIAQNTPELIDVSELILSHHERWDGNGYPSGLKGEDIPISCRILAVADAFDAMTNDRVYREAMSREAAIEEITDNSGTQFDPDIVALFLDVWESEDS
ncbi:MAG: HD domain-containing phosphohydrolase [Oscillospiraceae bacterium]